MAWIKSSGPARQPLTFGKNPYHSISAFFAVEWRVCLRAVIAGAVIATAYSYWIYEDSKKYSGVYQDAVRAEQREADQKAYAKEMADQHAKNGKRCQKDFKNWSAMPPGPEKDEKLAAYKRAYGSLNFHGNCVGNPRQ